MKTLWQNEQFLKDAFRDHLGSGARGDVVALMVTTARRARRARRARMAGITMGVIVVCSLWALAPLRRANPVRPSAEPALVQSAARPVWEIHSQNFDAIVRSEALGETAIVHSDKRPNYERLNDDELLDLFRDRPLALVRFGAETRIVNQ